MCWVICQRLKLAKSDLSPETTLSQLSRIRRHKIRITNVQPIEGISSINDLQPQVPRVRRPKNRRIMPKHLVIAWLRLALIESRN